MNIKQAKEQIKNAITAYYSKDEFGSYIIPVESQRPVFLLGPPGVGKTAIMQQIAEELGVGLVSYSMTHHTRQSALGLPYIIEKDYGGEKYSVSEYTMSEIIASVYEMIEKTGIKEGILFLDEINCVSETLAPAMLQFLQYKIFGKHRVPDGWIVVTAGNPPEYNNSVREFDVVTWDRLKRIDVEPVYDIWKEHAYKTDVHAAIISYLDIKKGDFYKIESTVDGKSFVTARGWSDLSTMIRIYEDKNIKVDEMLVAQYLQDKKIAKDFAIYYDLFNTYKSDYQVDKIINGIVDEGTTIRIKGAKFDERLSLVGLLIEALNPDFKDLYIKEQVIKKLLEDLKKVKAVLTKPDSKADAVEEVEKYIAKTEEVIDKNSSVNLLSKENRNILKYKNEKLEEIRANLIKSNTRNSAEAFALIKNYFDGLTKQLSEEAKTAGERLTNVFNFCEESFKDGQEILILVTELTLNFYSAHFIGKYGCDAYFNHNKELLFYERQREIISELENLELE